MASQRHAEQKLQIVSHWERPLIAEQNGVAHLLVLVTAPVGDVADRAPLDLVFVLDRSGSMSGRPLALVKQAASYAAGMLTPRDRVGLVVYGSDVDELMAPALCSRDTIARFRGELAGVGISGSTNLSGGWLTGCELLAHTAAATGEMRVRRTLLLTDGLANVGITEPSELVHHASELRKRGIGTTTMGVGDDFDELLLAGMADAGGGNFAYVEDPAQLQAFFQRELGDLLRVQVTGLRVGFRFPRGLRVHLVNPYPVSYASGRIDVAVGDLPDGDVLPLLFRIEAADAKAIGDALRLDLRAAWNEPAHGTGGRHEWRETLGVASAERVEATAVTPEVLEQRVILEASALQREAIRLDRAGRYRERAQLLEQAVESFEPLGCMMSPEAIAFMNELEATADESAGVALHPSVAKRSVANAFRRSRGQEL